LVAQFRVAQAAGVSSAIILARSCRDWVIFAGKKRAGQEDADSDWLFDGKYPILGEKFSVRNSTNGALFLGRRRCEMLLPLSYRWQPNIATTLSRPTMMSTSLHPPLLSPLCNPPILPIFSALPQFALVPLSSADQATSRNAP
jgi:hypothetical protein